MDVLFLQYMTQDLINEQLKINLKSNRKIQECITKAAEFIGTN